MAEESTAGARTSLIYLGAVAAAVVIAEAAHLPRLAVDTIYTLVGASVVVAIVVGVRRYRPQARRAWMWMAAGQALWVLADTTFNWQQDVLGVDTFPTISDLFYLLGYAALVVALVLLARSRTRTPDLGPWLDSATVTAGLSLLSWVLLARPTIAGLGDSPGAATVAAAYPAMDILLVGALVRLINSPGGRSTAFRLLLAAMALLISADTLSVAFGLFTANEVAGVEYLWLLSYAAWGAAALHPSMTQLSEPGTRLPGARFSGLRLIAVIVATMIAPAILAVQEVAGTPIDVWAVVIGSVVMFLLVVIRMNLAIDQIGAAHQALETLQDEMAVQATHDPLTGLSNRAHSMRLLAGALGRSRRRGNTVGVLFVDLDGFKAVNDTYGHRAGDVVLREIAQRMEQRVRVGDFAGRLGGDEFVIGLEDVADERAAAVLGQRLVLAAAEPIEIEDGLTVRVGASVGIALGRGGETDVESLLHEADVAVYLAKEAGRGRVEMFDSSAREELRRRNETERAVARAIAEDELVLHYQPIIETATGRIVCYEALVRWEQPGVGLVGPDRFLPTAEASDLICNLDVWVLHAALAQLAAWNRERGDRDLQVSVNISGRHLGQARVIGDVIGALRGAEVDPGQLVVEVTETAVTDDSLAAPHLQALRQAGVLISLDDFGTGYQSSSQLTRLPVDILKVDREFVTAATDSERSLLELMVRTAHAFGVRVVAEGVEEEDQLAFVRSLGCEYVQGYLLGRPAAADQLTEPTGRRRAG